MKTDRLAVQTAPYLPTGHAGPTPWATMDHAGDDRPWGSERSDMTPVSFSQEHTQTQTHRQTETERQTSLAQGAFLLEKFIREYVCSGGGVGVKHPDCVPGCGSPSHFCK